MYKEEKYEQVYIKATWLFIIATFFYYIFTQIISNPNELNMPWKGVGTAFFLLWGGLNYLKQQLYTKGKLLNTKAFIVCKTIEIMTLCILASLITRLDFSIFWFLFIVIITSLTRGRRIGFNILSIWVLISSSLFFYNYFRGEMFWESKRSDVTIVILFFLIQLVYFLLVLLCGIVHNESIAKDIENRKLVHELGDKYHQLSTAQDEIKLQYDKLKETNIKIEDTNKRLTSSIAEFFTLQQISEAISSIFNINELLKFVNDIIIGVMGVNNSTVILFDDKKKRLKVQATNITNKDELITINDYINSKVLLDALNSGKPIIENFADHSDYPFIKNRDVNSLICAPFGSKSRKFGLILIEHKYYNAFDDENMRLLDTIGKQVGIALENAELYQEIQELATKDGLTGVFNKHYFHERLQKEIKMAQELNYSLALAIFDIDHFKKFNDTFGHLFGDMVLKSLTALISKCLRNTDIIARFGGEEFILLFPHTTLKEAYDKVEDLRKKIENSTVKDNLVTASVTVSFGISCYPETSVFDGALIRNADDALYEAKKSGRNCTKIAKAIEL